VERQGKGRLLVEWMVLVRVLAVESMYAKKSVYVLPIIMAMVTAAMVTAPMAAVMAVMVVMVVGISVMVVMVVVVAISVMVVMAVVMVAMVVETAVTGTKCAIQSSQILREEISRAGLLWCTPVQ